MEMERLEQKRLREIREHEIPHLDFEFELPEDKISDEQRTKTRLIRFRLEQQTIQKMAEIRIQQFEVQIALQQQFYSQQINPEQLKYLINQSKENH